MFFGLLMSKTKDSVMEDKNTRDMIVRFTYDNQTLALYVDDGSVISIGGIDLTEDQRKEVEQIPGSVIDEFVNTGSFFKLVYTTTTGKEKFLSCNY